MNLGGCEPYARDHDPRLGSRSVPLGSYTSVNQHTPDEFERRHYYYGVSKGNDPELLYRSDFEKTFSRPTGGWGVGLSTKSLRGVHNSKLTDVWDSVGPKIVELLTARQVNWASIDPARFVTTNSDNDKGSLGPVVVWVGVRPGSTSSDIAHDISQEILVLLAEFGVTDVVVEWRETVLQRLAGVPL